MRRSWIFAAALLAIAGPASAAEGIAVLAADPWCPHTCEAGAERPGYMVEVAREALTAKGWTVEYRNAAWARVMRDVKAGKLDGAVGALAGEAGGTVLHDEPLGRQVNAFLVRADDAWAFAGLGSLRGRSVAAIKDYSYSAEIDAWLAANPKQVQALGGENALDRNLRKLLAGRVDVVLDDEAVLLRAVRTAQLDGKVRVAGRMAGGDLFIALTPAGTKGKRLAEALDQGIRDLRGSGRLAAIMATYGLKDWKD